MILEQILKAKWSKFQSSVRVFNHIPFVEFVLAAGSMAMGTAKEHSDFDVIIGAKKGRIFTARFLSIVFLSFFGLRAKSHDNFHNKAASADKICLNHFVTKGSYKLSPPHNEYWNRLYQSLVPLMGDKRKIKSFFAENCVWMNGCVVPDFSKMIGSKHTLIKKILIKVLSGKIGDFIESKLKAFQIKRIEAGLNNKMYKPRIIYSDNELEFHPNTERIEVYCAKLKDAVPQKVGVR